MVGNKSASTLANRRARSPMVVIASVVALVALIVSAYWLATDLRGEDTDIFILVALAPGALLALAWLVRLAQWWGAARAPGTSVMVTGYLAQGRQPESAGPVTRTAHALGNAGGVHSRPQGYAVWLTLTSRNGNVLQQRVVWDPWLRELNMPEDGGVPRFWQALGYPPLPDVLCSKPLTSATRPSPSPQ